VRSVAFASPIGVVSLTIAPGRFQGGHPRRRGRLPTPPHGTRLGASEPPAACGRGFHGATGRHSVTMLPGAAWQQSPEQRSWDRGRRDGVGGGRGHPHRGGVDRRPAVQSRPERGGVGRRCAGQYPQLQAEGVRVLVAPADEASARRLLGAADDAPGRARRSDRSPGPDQGADQGLSSGRQRARGAAPLVGLGGATEQPPVPPRAPAPQRARPGRRRSFHLGGCRRSGCGDRHRLVDGRPARA
jgi:hypothetical protein